MFDVKYIRQVELLLRCMPAIRNQPVFALKGGTALNLFVRNLPRLSVDIDLTYRYIKPRNQSLLEIQVGLRQIAKEIKQMNNDLMVKEINSAQTDTLIKLQVYSRHAVIKLEPNFVMRGTILPIQQAVSCSQVKDEFGIFIDQIPMLNESELYAGKICAALNRQHPRDLFDLKLLLESEGITDEIRKVFVVYLAGDARPIHEMLSPNHLDLKNVFEKEFARMSRVQVTLSDLINVRDELIKTLQATLTEEERQFLVSVKEGEPKYELLPFSDLDKLPALQWKLINIRKIEYSKHQKMLSTLKDVLEV